MSEPEVLGGATVSNQRLPTPSPWPPPSLSLPKPSSAPLPGKLHSRLVLPSLDRATDILINLVPCRCLAIVVSISSQLVAHEQQKASRRIECALVS